MPLAQVILIHSTNPTTKVMKLIEQLQQIMLLATMLLCSCVTARQQTHITVAEHEHPRIFQTNNPIK